MLGSPVTAERTVITSLELSAAHDRVLATMREAHYSHLDDGGTEVHAEHGDRNEFRLGSVSSLIGIAASFQSSDTYPISVDVSFVPVPGGTQVSVRAEAYKPPGYVTVPKRGPQGKRWRAACDDAVASITDMLTESLNT